MKQEQMLTKFLAAYQLWAADEMKTHAEKTDDAQLKDQYEQIAALNRIFYEKLAGAQEKPKKATPMQRETQRLLRAYFCEKALYDAFSAWMCRLNRPPELDETVDRLTVICRQLLDGVEQRLAVLQQQDEKNGFSS